MAEETKANDSWSFSGFMESLGDVADKGLDIAGKAVDIFDGDSKTELNVVRDQQYRNQIGSKPIYEEDSQGGINMNYVIIGFVGLLSIVMVMSMIGRR